MDCCSFCQDKTADNIAVPYSYIPGAARDGTLSDLSIAIPACGECRDLLGEVYWSSLEEAAGYLASVYRELYAHLLNTAKWERDELFELGHGLRHFVETSQRTKFETKERIASCDRVAVLGPEFSEQVLDEIAYAVSCAQLRNAEKS
ncbi:hypothetical protein [Azospirillum brasilense]|uniref:hypothetical protein n=1 Tax=Azospirillum brasilense TaxID=192 RepID=UPI001EDA76ED|nr:hypothetical protein [Azospirillum brasilense]UKJ75440.1 hypothetical protein H1Q64_14385 [Azospirillum brasilense]